MGLRKGVDSDNAKTYLDTDLPYSLDLIDVHDHDGATGGAAVNAVGILSQGQLWAFLRVCS